MNSASWRRLSPVAALVTICAAIWLAASTRSRRGVVLPARGGAGSLAFVGVRVLDVEADRLSPPCTVLVEDGLITSIGGASPGEGCQRIDGAGRVLMPGLIDGHVHLNMQMVDNPAGIEGVNGMTWEELGALAYETAHEYLYSGFTTVRDLCGTHDGMRRRIDEGTLTGPRMYLSGACISQTSGHGDWRQNSDVIRFNQTANSHVV